MFTSCIVLAAICFYAVLENLKHLDSRYLLISLLSYVVLEYESINFLCMRTLPRISLVYIYLSLFPPVRALYVNDIDYSRHGRYHLLHFKVGFQSQHDYSPGLCPFSPYLENKIGMCTQEAITAINCDAIDCDFEHTQSIGVHRHDTTSLVLMK